MSKYIITLVVFLTAIYVGLFFVSFKGWGYSGYAGNYHRGPSFWYWGGGTFYNTKSIRNSSIGGSGGSSGSFHSGK